MISVKILKISFDLALPPQNHQKLSVQNDTQSGVGQWITFKSVSRQFVSHVMESFFVR